MVVGDDAEWAAIEVRSELVGGPNDCETLLLGDGVVPLSLGKGSACVCDDVLDSLNTLHKYSAYAITTGVRVYFSRSFGVEVSKDRWRRQFDLELVESLSCVSIPNERSIFSKQGV